MRVARRQVVGGEEAALDECQQGGVVRHAVRHIVRFREGRDCYQRDADAQLIEGGAAGWERSGGSKAGTKIFFNRLALGAVQPTAWRLAYRWIGLIGALPWFDPVGGPCTALWGSRRRNMVIKTPVLVIDDKDDRLFPEIRVLT